MGILIGAVLAGVDLALSGLVSDDARSALLVATLVALTGALHLDGLIDTVDGLYAGPDANARLAAMRQSTASGPGAVAGVLAVLALYAAFSGLGQHERVRALMLAPLASRTAILLSYHLYPYARVEPTISRALKDGACRPRLMGGVASAGLFAIAVAGAHGLATLLLALLLAALIGRMILTRLPGQTGDTHGAIAEITQLAVLFVAPALLAP